MVNVFRVHCQYPVAALNIGPAVLVHGLDGCEGRIGAHAGLEVPRPDLAEGHGEVHG